MSCLSVNFFFHPALHKFPIEISYLFDIPGIKCVSLPLAGNWINASVHTMFDGILFLRADQNNVQPYLCVFSWVSSGLVYVLDSPVSVSPYLIVLSMVWGWPKVFYTMRYLYIISPIVFP